MLRYYFENEQENELMEQSKEFIFEQTDKKIEEAQKKLGQELFEKLSDDIETWMYERYDNVRRRYFDGIVAFLLDQNYTYIKNSETLEQWLSGIGYTQQSFRKKIYQDNKETINKAITYDAIYEALENLFSCNYFKNWNFGDITKGYPQSNLVRNFLHNLLEKDGFNEVIESMLDDKIKQRKRELDNLKKHLTEIKQKISELE